MINKTILYIENSDGKWLANPEYPGGCWTRDPYKTLGFELKIPGMFVLNTSYSVEAIPIELISFIDFIEKEKVLDVFRVVNHNHWGTEEGMRGFSVHNGTWTTYDEWNKMVEHSVQFRKKEYNLLFGV